MNKAELIQSVAAAAELKGKEAEALMGAFIDSVSDALKGGDKVALTGFGTFSVGERKARTGRNPQTGAEIKIPASKAPRFSAGKAFKDALK
ncbi:MAG: DNA-binding protein HU [Deltaproteobacteria bacterium]|nr:MAG: DNA-binding protein HU [Deltaproteobacteria bacterium]